MRFAWDASGLIFVLLSAVLVVVALAASLSIFRGRASPMWLGWLVLGAAAEVAARLGIVSDKFYQADLFLGFVPMFVWFLAVSVAMLVSQEP